MQDNQELLTQEEKDEIQGKIDEARTMMFYTLVIMGGKTYEIDEDELDVVEGGMQSGQFIKLKQAIINPSMITSVEPDNERITTWNNDIDVFEGRFNRTKKGYATVMIHFPTPPEMTDVFEKVDVRKKFYIEKKIIKFKDSIEE